MKGKSEKFLFVATVMILLMSGCGSNKILPRSLTVTFSGNKCSYSVEKAVAAGEINFILIDNNPDLDAAMIALTLDKGKTVEDLKALPVNQGDDPLWSHRVGAPDRHVRPGASYTFKATIKKGPIYLICLSGSPEGISGVLGPIEVTR